MNISIDPYEINQLIENVLTKEKEFRNELTRIKDDNNRLLSELKACDKEKDKFEVMASTLQGRVDALTLKLSRYEPALTKKEMEEDDTY